MKTDLKGKVAVVTGGARGIGKAIAMAFAEEGAHVVIFDLDSEDSDLIGELRKMMSEFDKKHLYKKADVTNTKEVFLAVKEAVKVFGTVDVLVNNAGGGMAPIPLENLREKDWDWAIALNLKGTYICTQAVIKYMKKQKSGKIVNISSQAGRSKSELSNLPYACAKAGVLGFTRQLAHESGQFGINVNAIAPGITERVDRKSRWEEISEEDRQKMLEAIPLRRRGRPEEIARVAVFLASESASYITGATIDVNGGRFMM